MLGKKPTSPARFRLQESYRICGNFNGHENGNDKRHGSRINAVSVAYLN
jgi:hypothetical protein